MAEKLAEIKARVTPGYLGLSSEDAAWLVAEVERLKPLAAIGSGVLAMADYERQGIFYGHRATLSVALYGDDSAVEEWLVNDCHLLFGRGSTAGEALRAAGLLKEKPNGTR